MKILTLIIFFLTTVVADSKVISYKLSTNNGLPDNNIRSIADGTMVYGSLDGIVYAVRPGIVTSPIDRGKNLKRIASQS